VHARGAVDRQHPGLQRAAQQIANLAEEHLEPLARVDYISIVDTRDLEPLETLADDATVLIALAVFVGKTRLIDNILL
jgi:pantoate--beta-alanine ligase